MIFSLIPYLFNLSPYFVPIIGLSVENPLSIGLVTFWPLEEKMEELRGMSSFQSIFFDNLSVHNSSIASAKIVAEDRKSPEILRALVEESLTILRYLGTLIWWDQPYHHIYTSGREISRVSYTLIRDNEEIVASVGESAYDVSPFKLDEDILGLAEAYGLIYFSSLLTSQDITLLEQSILTALRWYSDGIQDLSPSYAFMKYYVAIEALVKQEKDKAAKVLPKRLPYLLSQGYPTNYKKQKKEIRKLIEERNHVFHSGNPKELKIEFLAWRSSLLARNAINNLRMLLETHKMQTKQDLADWVQNMEKD